MAPGEIPISLQESFMQVAAPGKNENRGARVGQIGSLP
jgi:hypothetical protein